MRWDLLVLGFFVLGGVILFKDAIFGGLFFKETDTTTFYYPDLVVLQRAIREFRFPFWTPEIFAGFPLWADGEMGLFYWPNWVVLALWNADAAITVLRFLHVVLAATGAYVFLRVLGVSRWGGAMGGITFAFGSFLTMQMHHANVIASAAWLPWILACLHLAITRPAPQRLGWIGLGALAVTTMSLGVHLQIVLMTLGMMAVYGVFAAAALPVPLPLFRAAAPGDPPPGRPDALLGRGLVLVLALGGMGVLGIGMAMVQLVPLLELATQSWRGAMASLAFSSSYNASWFNLSNLVLPYLFRDDARLWWTLWAEWETNFYAGIVPLAMAVLALIFVRGRQVWFWGGTAILSFILALGLNAPTPLFELIWRLPGFTVLRAPGRFSLLMVFAIAVLAGFGFAWLVRTLSRRETPAWLRLTPALVVTGAVLAVVLGGVWLAGILFSLHQDTAVWIQANYLSLPQGRTGMTGEMVRRVLVNNLTLADRHTVVALAEAAGLVLLLWGMVLVPCLARWLAGGLLGLALLGLANYALDFHPLAVLEDLTTPSPAVVFLQQRQADALDRTFVTSDWFELEPNQLLPWGVPTIDGYSSLQPGRAAEYVARLQRADATLLDLAGVRYIVVPKTGPVLPRQQGVSYYLRAPLAAGREGNPNAISSYRVPGVTATRVRILGNYQGTPLPDGTPLVRVTAWDAEGRSQQVTFVAGRDLGRQEPPGSPEPRSTGFTVDRIDGTGRIMRGNLYGAAAPLDQPLAIAEIRFEVLAPDHTVLVSGAALEGPGGSYQVDWYESTRYFPVFDDPDVTVLENTQAFPRAFLVRESVLAANPGQALNLLVNGPVDPARTVVLEEPVSLSQLPPGVPAGLDAVTVTGYSPERVDLRVQLDQPAFLVLADSWYPGWQAFVDGRPVEILRANYLYRALALPPGDHRVTFAYQPRPLAAGALLSLVALVPALTLIAWAIRERRRAANGGGEDQAR